jgi:hypothetical protein
MCGAVRYEADVADTFGICYCKMCQRWAAGVFMGVGTQNFRIAEGAGNLEVFKSSEWAERGFCRLCGSSLYYHAPEHDNLSVAYGTLDDTSGLTARVQYFVDKKPEGFSLEQQTEVLTEAQIEAIYGQPVKETCQ